MLAAALADLPFVAAVKAEAPPTPPAIATLTARLDVPVFGGLGGIGLLDELAAGSAGAMTGFSFPEGLLACVSAFRSGGYEAAREAFLPYLPLVNFEQQVRHRARRPQGGAAPARADRRGGGPAAGRVVPGVADASSSTAHLAAMPHAGRGALTWNSD